MCSDSGYILKIESSEFLKDGYRVQEKRGRKADSSVFS